MKKNKIKSYSKINLTLKVLKKFNNGYHNINSLITFGDLHDLITINKIKNSNDKISFSGKFKKGINKKLNTVTKVLHILRKENYIKRQAFRINVQKNIPHGSGLGGGSSNAANLLNFFNKKMNLKLNKNTLNKMAGKIGFDVPISLEKKNTLVTGRKEEILRLNQKFKLNILIIYPNIICSTKKIYEKNKDLTFSKLRYNFSFRSKKKLINFLKNEKNDLQNTVIKFYPQIKKIIDFVANQNGCYFSRITGSGSACIGIFSDMKTAILAKKSIKLKFPKYWSVVSKTM